MNWNSAADFWAMGGYALYVWASFGACCWPWLWNLFRYASVKNQLTTLHRQVLAEKLERELK